MRSSGPSGGVVRRPAKAPPTCCSFLDFFQFVTIPSQTMSLSRLTDLEGGSPSGQPGPTREALPREAPSAPAPEGDKGKKQQRPRLEVHARKPEAELPLAGTGAEAA